ncbi:hypothetical protein ASD64_01510 [Mesorhizobium sp. Root157]|uniref:hypothetical protein n=1 Tax=Mesorhizobium sp. Root157 TaxID=1736477 RepID=UPI0006F66150|nr:hypothetical protein [Mesorhizobium sp. Root157]KRA00277.1 hypothetical protein ASD64_01510 [Mesorhizobium sp. Root157]
MSATARILDVMCAANGHKNLPVIVGKDRYLVELALLRLVQTSGYRILGPDELDPVTVERCAAIADKRARIAATVSHEAAVALLVVLPGAIRALSPEAPQPEAKEARDAE